MLLSKIITALSELVGFKLASIKEEAFLLGSIEYYSP
jgi:hypothetical protein